MMGLPAWAAKKAAQEWSPEQRKVLRWLALGLGTSVVGGGMVWLLRKQYRQWLANRAGSDSLESDSSGNYANSFLMAFENDNWPGTDEVRVRRTMRAIPSKAVFEQVEKDYEALASGEKLWARLKVELATTEHDEIVAIYSAKPEHRGGYVDPALQARMWAIRLRAAMDYRDSWGIPGTDLDALMAVLEEVPNRDRWYQVEQAFRRLAPYEDLKEALREELNSSEEAKIFPKIDHILQL